MTIANKAGPRFGTAVPIILLIVVGSVLCCAITSVGGVPDETCADCHDELVAAFEQTTHGTYFGEIGRMEGQSCESCHGSALEHVEEGEPESIINPAKHDEFGGTQLCLTCHDGHTFDNWMFSGHSAAGVTCADCHTVHQAHSSKTSTTTTELCYGCHTQVRAESFMPSRHPIAEGKMSCLDCHGVHGEDAPLAQNGTGRELCFGCHAEKEGPFVFEHAPVSEDCMMCHTAHGSVANNLLKQNEPALCLNCHPMHFHATVDGLDGSFTPPATAPDRTTMSTPDGWKTGMLTKCTQCHTTVHGTDLPSQSITTGGGALTR
ncbi:MAG: DmsE family decaheme c-type cytochrome [candidate division Zixibacteria bacterium]|nr:DmsE family decaheme c-type cytochrome [candidate division Zixibacteria bacterium]